jgi:major membrane immunogen (membrane-anchored lipoprotein)
MKHFLTIVIAAALAITSCDIPSASFEANYFTFDNQAGRHTIEVKSTGLDKLILDFHGEEPWLEVVDIIYESTGYANSTTIETKALAQFKDKIIIEIKENTTGNPRSMEITSQSFSAKDIAIIIQEE